MKDGVIAEYNTEKMLNYFFRKRTTARCWSSAHRIGVPSEITQWKSGSMDSA